MSTRLQSPLKHGIRASVTVHLIWFTFLSAQAAEYCMRPGKGNSVICCSTPVGWQGWKDEPHYEDRIKRLDPLSKAWVGKLVSFHQPNCKEGPECPYLSLDTRGRDSRGQPDVETGLRKLLQEKEQLQDLSPRKPPCIVGSRFGSFHTENSGDLTILRIRCPSGSQQLVTLFAQHDVLVTIELWGPNFKDILPKLDSFKELARSVRFTDASLTLPDIVDVNPDHLSDEAIRQELLQLTPIGTAMEKVYDLLELRLESAPGYGHVAMGLQWAKGDLWMQLGNYPQPGPFATIVEAFWRSDKHHKLRGVEIRRRVYEYKFKRALPVEEATDQKH
jgi:hypothetical protein